MKTARLIPSGSGVMVTFYADSLPMAGIRISGDCLTVDSNDHVFSLVDAWEHDGITFQELREQLFGMTRGGIAA
jgi:hypothetical protein